MSSVWLVCVYTPANPNTLSVLHPEKFSWCVNLALNPSHIRKPIIHLLFCSHFSFFRCPFSVTSVSNNLSKFILGFEAEEIKQKKWIINPWISMRAISFVLYPSPLAPRVNYNTCHSIRLALENCKPILHFMFLCLYYIYRKTGPKA